MISRRLLLTTLTLACLAPIALAQDGVIRLEKPISNASKTLIKVFSYDCPFCYRFDTSIDPTLLEALPEMGLTFKPMHLESRAQYGRVASLFFAYCLLKDQENKISLESDASLFARAKETLYFAYLKQKERWPEGETAFIKTLSEATQISAEEFQKARLDARVVALANHWKEIIPVADIQGVPAYIVHGKYLIETKSIRSKKDFIERVRSLARYE